MTNTFLVTSALPYANGPLHLGHIAGAYLPADIFVRYQRLAGNRALFICGTDEHGVPVTIRAEQEGKTPQQVVDFFHAQMKESFDRLGIRFDNFSRTSLPIHHEISQKVFLRLLEKGAITTKTEEQHFCNSCSRFLPDRYIRGECPYCHDLRARGDQCEACGKWLEPKQMISPRCALCGSEPVISSTKHWFLRLGLFQERLRQWLDSKPDWKDNVKEFCAGWFREGLGDRAITRDIDWGIKVPLPEAEGKVLYVWFDAPIGYISSTVEWAQKNGTPEAWKDYWMNPEVQLIHFIGKDNIVFHAMVWPAVLMGHGDFILPSEIPANEFLTIEGDKLSTSRNWAIWVDEYLLAFPPDPLRYCLAANAPENKDSDFSWKEFQNRNNSELADIMGNFINRTLSFLQKYRDNTAPAIGEKDELDSAALQAIESTSRNMGQAVEAFEMRRSARELMDLARCGNKYFADKKPWATRKTDPQLCDTTLAVCLRMITAMAVLMEPLLPHSAVALRKMLQAEDIFRDIRWADIPKLEIPSGHKLGEPQILFQKIEDLQIQSQIDKLHAIKK